MERAADKLTPLNDAVEQGEEAIVGQEKEFVGKLICSEVERLRECS
ncbi:hypothetical protein COLO4_21385 [Corchorus olitorius]|uniref:Uncharacterized protein n=1 Tax=Corchorus olitorius TaxID=93759 RepID=A0A1R3ITR5_9ROSI|nr:hypothetical protein COLO4_21385 [Corchorus olitorius]